MDGFWLHFNKALTHCSGAHYNPLVLEPPQIGGTWHHVGSMIIKLPRIRTKQHNQVHSSYIWGSKAASFDEDSWRILTWEKKQR